MAHLDAALALVPDGDGTGARTPTPTTSRSARCSADGPRRSCSARCRPARRHRRASDMQPSALTVELHPTGGAGERRHDHRVDASVVGARWSTGAPTSTPSTVTPTRPSSSPPRWSCSRTAASRSRTCSSRCRRCPRPRASSRSTRRDRRDSRPRSARCRASGGAATPVGVSGCATRRAGRSITCSSRTSPTSTRRARSTGAWACVPRRPSRCRCTSTPPPASSPRSAPTTCSTKPPVRAASSRRQGSRRGLWSRDGVLLATTEQLCWYR